MLYEVRLPLADGNGWFTLCRCEAPEMVAEIVRILLSADRKQLYRIEITVVPT